MTSLEIKALSVIEDLVLNANQDEKNELLNLIYRIAHAGRTPICRGSHIEWERKIIEMYEEAKKQS